MSDGTPKSLPMPFTSLSSSQQYEAAAGTNDLQGHWEAIYFIFLNKGNVNITRSMSKMPLSKFPLWLSSLLFSTSFPPSPPLSPCQVVRMTLILKTGLFSFPDSDRAPTCHPETIPQKPINSFKSKINPCALSTGAGSVPSTKDRCNSKEKCKCTCISIGLKNLNQFVFLDPEITVSSSILRKPLETNFPIKPKT